ncbi:hypothetical protein [Anaerosporobacter sp.]|uniref:hypothetical protein n=1 Tax=Anaerosporobacter sp. TaxID=1872529 RepID=UPI00286EBE64|nr:hypothetical protein [Anaerosporobacter sp.]
MLIAKTTDIESISEYSSEMMLKVKLKIETVSISNIKTIQINELDIALINSCDDAETGTTLKIVLDKELFGKCTNNLHKLDVEKGNFITPIDLMFASTKKKDVNINFSIDTIGNYTTKYSGNKVHFYNNNSKIGANLLAILSDKSNFTYLIPSERFGKTMPCYVEKWKFNYFSTYELTGLVGTKELPRFFINIPTIDVEETDYDLRHFITPDRKALQENKKTKIEKYLINDVKNMIVNSEKGIFFDEKENTSYLLSYIYGYLEFKSKDSQIASEWEKLKSTFAEYVHIQIGDKLTALKDFRVFNRRSESAYELSGLNIYFTKKDYWEYGYDFNFYMEGKNVFNLTERVYKDKFYSNEFSILTKILLDFCRYRVESAWRLELENIESKEKPFDENLLKKLLKIIKEGSHQINQFYDSDKDVLVIDEVTYTLTDEFKINNLETIKDAAVIKDSDFKSNQNSFQKRLIELYKKTLFPDYSNTSHLDLLKKYKAERLQLKYDSEKNNVVGICYGDLLIDRIIDCSDIEYNDLIEIVGHHYYWFINKYFSDYFKNPEQLLNSAECDRFEISSQYTQITDTIYTADCELLKNFRCLYIYTQREMIIDISSKFQTDTHRFDKLYVVYNVDETESSDNRIDNLVNNGIMKELGKMIDAQSGGQRFTQIFSGKMLIPLSKEELLEIFDAKAIKILNYFITKAAVLMPENNTSQSINPSSTDVEQWIAQALGTEHVGGGNEPIDILKSGHWGADIKFVTWSGGNTSNEVSLSQNFKNAGANLDLDFKDSDGETIVEGFKKILRNKLAKNYGANKIYYFMLIRTKNKVYLCACLVNSKAIDNIEADGFSEESLLVKNVIDEKFGETKIYKAKKRLELRLLPSKWINDNMVVEFDIPQINSNIDLRSIPDGTLDDCIPKLLSISDFLKD